MADAEDRLYTTPEVEEMHQQGTYFPIDVYNGRGTDPEGPRDDLDFLLDATYTVDADRFIIEYTDEDGHDWRIVYRIQPDE